MPGLSLGTGMPNLKSTALTILLKLSTGLTDQSTAYRDTDRQTLNENITSAIHSVHLPEIIKQ